MSESFNPQNPPGTLIESIQSPDPTQAPPKSGGASSIQEETMTGNPSSILALITQQIIDVYRPIVKASGKALHKATKMLDEIHNHIEETQEREKHRAYTHLITPPGAGSAEGDHRD